MSSLKGSTTETNLLTAFAGESQARNRYTYFAVKARKEGFVAILSVPLTVKDAVLGVLRLYSTDKRSFSDDEMDILTKFAEQGSRAIENALSYEQVRSDTENTFRHLVHEDSIVVWHDYAYNPEEIRFEVLAGILDGTDPAIHDEIYHVSQTKCAVYLKKKIQGRFLDPPEEPDEYFEIKMKKKPIPPK